MFTYKIDPVQDYDGGTMYDLSIFEIEEELNDLGNVTDRHYVPVDYGFNMFSTLGAAESFARDYIQE